MCCVLIFILNHHPPHQATKLHCDTTVGLAWLLVPKISFNSPLKQVHVEGATALSYKGQLGQSTCGELVYTYVCEYHSKPHQALAYTLIFRECRGSINNRSFSCVHVYITYICRATLTPLSGWSGEKMCPFSQHPRIIDNTTHNFDACRNTVCIYVLLPGVVDGHIF